MERQIAPSCLDLEVTAACNLRCQYCYLRQTTRRGAAMSAKTADSVVAYLAELSKQCPAWQPMEINFTGGEPFLNFPAVQRIVDGTERLALRTVRTIFTNGASATPQQVEWCKQRDIRPRRSTGGCPEASSMTRPGDYLERYVEERYMWRDWADSRRLVVIPETAHHVFASVRWLHESGYYGPVDLATDDYAAWPTEAQDAYEDEVSMLAEECVYQWKQGRVLAIENFMRFAKAIFGQPNVMVLGCGASLNTLGITWDGRIVPCHRFFGESPDSGLCAGRLCDILSGSPVRFGGALVVRIAEWWNGVEHEPCPTCDARQCCQHGCLHVSRETRGNLWESPPARCRFVRLYARLARRIHSRLGGQDKWWERPATPCWPLSNGGQ